MANSFVEDFKNLVRTGNILVKLVVLNAAIFLVANVLVHIAGLVAFVDYIELPGTFEWWVPRFWTLFTYMFFHLDFGHVFWNMVWLYSLGRIFIELIGEKRLLAVYILGGLAGGLLYLGINSLQLMGPPLYGSSLKGASAGVMAVVVATGAFAPNYRIHLLLIGSVRLKYVALFSFIITSIIDFSMNTGGKVAHMGGALFGLLYGLQYKEGRDLVRPFTGLFSRKPKSHLKVKYKKPITDEDYNAHRLDEQQVIDSILDKISKSGYDSLSKKEKEILFRASNKGDKGF